MQGGPAAIGPSTSSLYDNYHTLGLSVTEADDDDDDGDDAACDPSQVMNLFIATIITYRLLYLAGTSMRAQKNHVYSKNGGTIELLNWCSYNSEFTCS